MSIKLAEELRLDLRLAEIIFEMTSASYRGNKWYEWYNAEIDDQ